MSGAWPRSRPRWAGEARGVHSPAVSSVRSGSDEAGHRRLDSRSVPLCRPSQHAATPPLAAFCRSYKNKNKIIEQGRIQDFHWGGGGAKDYVRPRTSRARTPEVPYDRVGVTTLPWKLSGFFMLSRPI